MNTKLVTAIENRSGIYYTWYVRTLGIEGMFVRLSWSTKCTETRFLLKDARYDTGCGGDFPEELEIDDYHVLSENCFTNKL